MRNSLIIFMTAALSVVGSACRRSGGQEAERWPKRLAVPEEKVAVSDGITVSLGGFGSSMAYRASDSTFWLLTDRGPNVDGKDAVSKVFVLPDYAPCVGVFKWKGDTLEKIRQITLKDEMGNDFCGLPNVKGDGVTGEIKSNTVSAIPNTLYRLTVENGGVGATVDGEYAAQNEVTIHAGTRENSVFLGWTSSNDAVFADASSPDTTLTMPAADTTITANWHTHSWSAAWSSDETSHWHACSGCDEKHEEAEHSFKWVIDKAATATQAGSKHEECSVCGYAKAAVEIPATGTSGNPSTGTNRPSGGNRPGGTTSPHTGDARNITLWLGLLLVSGTGLGAAVIYRRKHYNKAK